MPGPPPPSASYTLNVDDLLTSSDEEGSVIEAQAEPVVHQVEGYVIGSESDDDAEEEEEEEQEQHNDDPYSEDEEEYDDDIFFPDPSQIAPPQFIDEDFYPTAEEVQAAYSEASVRPRRDPDGFKEFIRTPDVDIVEFTYDGFNEFQVPENVTHIKFDDTVVSIPDRAFYRCGSLMEVEFNDGLVTIGVQAFAHCTSLEELEFPCSVRRILEEAFLGCTRLRMICFFDCSTWLSEINMIGPMAFRNCRSLMRLNLPESLGSIGSVGSGAFQECRALRNVTVDAMGAFYIEDFENFNQRFPRLQQIGVESGAMIDQRFDYKPLHCWLFCNSHDPECEYTAEAFDSFRADVEAEKKGKEEEDGDRLAEVDKFGMTRLHLLVASSFYHDIEMYRSVLEEFPEDIAAKDAWGILAIEYAFMIEVPRDVLELLVAEHAKHPKETECGPLPPYGFVENLVNLLISVDVNVAFLHDFIEVHETAYPQMAVDWEFTIQHVVNRHHRHLEELETGTPLPHPSLDCLKHLARLHVWDRLASLDASERERAKANELIDAMTFGSIMRQLEHLQDLITCWELKQTANILELALWKSKLDMASDEEGLSREACRVNSGANIVIKGVLAYFRYNANETYDSEPCHLYDIETYEVEEIYSEILGNEEGFDY